MSPQTVPFVDHGSTQQSANDGGAELVIATDPERTGLGHLATRAQSGRLYIGVFAGAQRTGGFAVRVERIERDGDRLVVRAQFTEPPPGALTIQVLTSPAQLVSIDRQQATGARDAILMDGSGVERARVAVPQSQP